MRIRFETTIDDAIAFHRFHVEHSPAMRQQRLTFALLVPGMLVFFGAIGFLVNLESAFEDLGRFFVICAVLFGIGVIVSFAWFFFGWWYYPITVEQNARKMYAEGNNRTILGWREMELVGDRLIVESSLVKSSYDLRAVEDIAGNGDYAFVYIAAVQAFIIPLTRSRGEENRQFIAELREAWENRDELEHEPAPRRPDERIVEKPY